MIISIVGGGATGITMLRHLTELACSKRYGNLVTGIQLFDKSGFDGGVAYRTQSDHHLLNMKASKMSIRVGDDQDDLAFTIYADATEVEPDREGRVVLPDALAKYAALDEGVAFVGLGRLFQIWEPAAAERRVAKYVLAF